MQLIRAMGSIPLSAPLRCPRVGKRWILTGNHEGWLAFFLVLIGLQATLGLADLAFAAIVGTPGLAPSALPPAGQSRFCSHGV